MQGKSEPSPLTRGTRIFGFQSCLNIRFIPAYAGNSLRASSERSSFCGSSPLTRGTPYPRSFPIIAGRFIPAYAGNSGLRPAFLKSPTVHPRLRGELVYLNVMAGVPNGSSPLTRGTHDLSDAIAIFGRFIPAYAGNSLTLSRRAIRPLGSSPLTRGTHLKWLQHYTNRLTAKLLKNISKQE